jgi:hypothetical protein
MTEQAATATNASVVIETRRAVFSGTSVDIEVAARAEGGSLKVAGVSARGAELAGINVTSAHIRRDGTALLRFPASAWPDGVPNAVLSIREVTVFGASGGLEPLAGDWQLTIDLPEGDEAEAARAVVALEPVTVELAGQEVTVETFLTPSATLVRYVIPIAAPRMNVPAPTLRVGDTAIASADFLQRENVGEIRYGPVASSGPLTLAFDGVVAVEPLASPWELRLMLGGEGPLTLDRPEIKEHELQWEIEDSTGEPPAIRSVVIQRSEDERVVLRFDGSSWRPGPTPPVVVGDGKPMRVVGTGFGLRDGQPESNIHAQLGSSAVPKELVVTAAEQEVPVPSTEVVLRP